MRAAPLGLPSAHDTPGSAAPTRDLGLPSLEEMAARNRRAVRRTFIRLTVRIVLVEIWLTSFIGTIVAAHGQPPEQALTTITHPWMWWTVPEAFPVLAAGTVMILMSVWVLFLNAVFVLRGPECDAAVFRRHLYGDEHPWIVMPSRRLRVGRRTQT